MIVAGFAAKATLLDALDALARAGVGGTQTYTPEPLRDYGPDAAASPLPFAMLVVFVFAALGFFGLQVYADTVGYPINIGGRPDNSWPAFITNAFEAGVLAAMAAGVGGYFAINGMPRLYHPADACAALRLASRDGWFVSVRDGDPDRVVALLRPFGPIACEQVPG